MNLINIAAKLARGDSLNELYTVCDLQRSISTNKLIKIAEQIQRDNCILANEIKRIHDEQFRKFEP